MQQLSNSDSGRHLVSTATGSHYILDLDTHTLHRTMNAAAPTAEYVEVEPSRLRRDGEPVGLLMLETCQVGAAGRFWLHIRDHVPTLRETSPIVRIEELVTPRHE